MRIIEQEAEEDELMQISFELSRTLLWTEELRIADSLVTDPRVSSFLLLISAGEIGGGGSMVNNAKELPSFLKEVEGQGSGDLEGHLVVNGKRADFFFWDERNVTFIAQSDAKKPLSELLESAERKVLG